MKFKKQIYKLKMTDSKSPKDLISQLLDQTVHAYIKKVSTTYSLEHDKLMDLWNTTVSGFELSKVKSTKVSDGNTCEQKTKTGSQCKLKAKEGSKFCKRHSEDNSEPKKKKTTKKKKEEESDSE